MCVVCIKVMVVKRKGRDHSNDMGDVHDEKYKGPRTEP